MVTNLRHNLEATAEIAPLAAPAFVQLLDWGSLDGASELPHPPDVVIGSDLSYEPAAIPLLTSLLGRLLRPRGSASHAVLVLTRRSEERGPASQNVPPCESVGTHIYLTSTCARAVLPGGFHRRRPECPRRFDMERWGFGEPTDRRLLATFVVHLAQVRVPPTCRQLASAGTTRDASCAKKSSIGSAEAQ